MTVNTTSNKITLQADGSTTQWNFPFPGWSTSSIIVFIVDNLGNQIQLNPNQFSVTLNPPVQPNPTSIGGFVTYPLVGSPLGVGEQLIIVRQLSPIQPVSLSNQSVIYPPVIEQEFDYLTMLDQGGGDVLSRAFTANPIDPTPAPTVPVAQRAQQWAFFDSNGNLTPAQAPGGAVAISAAMQPVVGAATLPLARQLMGIDAPATVINTTYAVTAANARQLLVLTGNNFYTLTFADPSQYANTFWVHVFNADTRGKLISLTGTVVGPSSASFILWPTQEVWIFNAGTEWLVTNPSRWHSDTAQNFYVDYANGNDASDGLGTTVQAFKNLQQAINTVQLHCDGNFVINMANGTHVVGSGVTCSMPVPGTVGYNIVGNTGSPQSVVLLVNSGGIALSATNQSHVNISGVEIVAAGGSITGLNATLGASINASFISLGNHGSSGIGLRATTNGVLNITPSVLYLESGANFAYVAYADTNALLVYDPGQTTVNGNVAVSGAYLYGAWCSTIHSGGTAQAVSNIGLVSGKQYLMSLNATGTFGGGPVPGTVSGTVQQGGIFV